MTGTSVWGVQRIAEKQYLPLGQSTLEVHSLTGQVLWASIQCVPQTFLPEAVGGNVSMRGAGTGTVFGGAGMGVGFAPSLIGYKSS